VEQKRFRQLVWLAVAASALLLAVAGWSQLRLRAARAEIDALSSETIELATRNDRLRRQVESHEAVRQRLRSEGARVILTGNTPGKGVATAYLDESARLALLSVEALRVDASCAYQLRVVSSGDPDRLITFGVDPDGNVELLLDDLPETIEELRIERGDTADVLLSGRR